MRPYQSQQQQQALALDINYDVSGMDVKADNVDVDIAKVDTFNI